MKRLKKITAFILISLVMQMIIYYYIDKNIMNYDIEIEAVKSKESYDKKSDAIVIPDNCKDISISPSGRYLAYTINDYFYIIDTYTYSNKIINLGKDYYISSYKWLADSDRVVIVKSKSDNYNIEYFLSYYDADRNINKDITHITWDNKLSQSEISVSSITGLIYLTITSKNKSSIYSVDTMSNIEKVNLKTNNIYKIDTFKSKGSFVFQELNNYNTFLYENNSYKKLYPNYDNLRLIGVDDKYNIYYGKVEKNKITAVMYGSIDKNELNCVKLTEKYDINDIILIKNGYILLNKADINIIENIKNKKQYKYSGTLIEVNDNYIVSLVNGKILKENIKDILYN